MPVDLGRAPQGMDEDEGGLARPPEQGLQVAKTDRPLQGLGQGSRGAGPGQRGQGHGGAVALLEARAQAEGRQRVPSLVEEVPVGVDLGASENLPPQIHQFIEVGGGNGRLGLQDLAIHLSGQAAGQVGGDLESPGNHPGRKLPTQEAPQLDRVQRGSRPRL